MIILSSFPLIAALVFAFALGLNLTRKNTTLVWLYLLQSVVVTWALALLAYSEGATSLYLAALLTHLVKGIMAPVFLTRLIRRYSAHFSAASYLNTPHSLFALGVITAFSYTVIAPALSAVSSASAVPLLFASIFSTLFLMVNRRGALGEVIGVLALENSAVVLAAFLGIQHSFALEFAIAFDIA